jgi:two-component system, LytTR family, sensor histidine kinase AgrC
VSLFSILVFLAKVFSNTIALIYILMLVKVIYKKSVNLLVLLFSSLSMGIIITSVIEFVFSGSQLMVLKTFFSFFISILFIKTIYRDLSIYQCLLTALINVISAAFCNAISFIIVIRLGFTMGELQKLSETSATIIFLINLFVALFEASIIGLISIKRTFSRYSDEVKSKANKYNIITLVFIFTILSFNMAYTYMYSYRDTGNTIIIMTLILSLGYLIYTFVNTNVIFKLESKTQELDNQIFYNKSITAIYEDVRRIRHDYKNQIMIIGSLIKSEKWDELIKYIEELDQDFSIRAQGNMAYLINIKSAGLLGLMSSKVKYAMSKDVELQIVVKSEINEINMKITQACELIGILIDNAIEYSSKYERYVNISISCENGNFLLEIMNPIKEDDNINIRDIYQQGFSTKGEGRGNGLYIAKKIVDNFKNVILNTQAKERMFVQQLIISENI